MTRNPWTLVALALTAAGAIAAASPRATRSDDAKAALEMRPKAPQLVCEDHKVGETFGGDPNGCREYLDACLGDLTTQQRAEWTHSVDACLADHSTSFYSCYAQVPWC